MSRKDIKNRRQKKIRHILKVATEVFSQKGYAGASTNEIADLAGISKRSMYYYVGDKETLYDSVLDELRKEAEKLLDIGVKENQTPEDKLSQLIHGMARAGNNRHLHAIVLRELVSGGKALPKTIVEGIDHGCGILSGILEEGEKKSGFIRLSSPIVYLILMSFFVYWNLVAPLMVGSDKRSENITAFGQNASDSPADEIERMLLKLLKTC